MHTTRKVSSHQESKDIAAAVNECGESVKPFNRLFGLYKPKPSSLFPPPPPRTPPQNLPPNKMNRSSSGTVGTAPTRGTRSTLDSDEYTFITLDSSLGRSSLSLSQRRGKGHPSFATSSTNDYRYHRSVSLDSDARPKIGKAGGNGKRGGKFSRSLSTGETYMQSQSDLMEFDMGNLPPPHPLNGKGKSTKPLSKPPNKNNIPPPPPPRRTQLLERQSTCSTNNCLNSSSGSLIKGCTMPTPPPPARPISKMYS